jgi:hypothetical protein
VGLRDPWLAKPWGYLLLVGRLYLACSSHASVAIPLNLSDLARSHIHLEGAIAPDSTCGQRNPKAALIISCERCNRVISLLYNESSIRKRSRIGNAQSRRPTEITKSKATKFFVCSVSFVVEMRYRFMSTPEQNDKEVSSTDLDENSGFNGAELSESVLGRDWNSPEEDAAWSNL